MDPDVYGGLWVEASLRQGGLVEFFQVYLRSLSQTLGLQAHPPTAQHTVAAASDL